MVLCIDTITRHAGIALVDGKQCYAMETLPVFQASDGIMGAIDSVVRAAGATLKDLTAVMVIKGPGSFTGLRVGIAVANQFSHQLSIPILGVRTDEWAACSADISDFLYLQTMNREEVYAFRNKSEIVKLKDLISTSGEVHWLGELSEAHEAILPENFKKMESFRSTEDTWVRVADRYSQELQPRKTYALIEPYYGKEPMITRSKRM